MIRWCLAVVVLTFAAEVRADDEVTALETSLNRQTTELATSDCVSACKALNSIRRAADRICELAPGPRCDAARAKADAATRKVKEACPECAIAEAPKLEDEQRATRPPEPSASTAPEAAPPPGGCRSCATSSGAPEYGDLAVLGLAALLVNRRSRKGRRRV